jgi:hypothetical protein
MIEVSTGHLLSENEKAHILTALEAKAVLAERNGLPKTAEHWRKAIENVVRRQKALGTQDRNE